MLVNLNEILSIAKRNKHAIGAFNTPNLESLMAVIETAINRNVPVIIMHAQVHESIMPLDVIGPIMVNMAKKACVPICVHLDHGEDIEYLHRALEMGFTSVMFDGSTLSYDENVNNTLRVIWMARQYGAGVEAEIGIMGGSEINIGDDNRRDEMYTDPDLALRFINDTGIDALACSFGTVHGFYQTEPKLDFTRIQKIYELINLPLVMHGGSGIRTEDYTRAIKCGICKINYYSYMSYAGVKAVADKINNENDVKYFHDIALTAKKGMVRDIDNVIKIFYGKR